MLLAGLAAVVLSVTLAGAQPAAALTPPYAYVANYGGTVSVIKTSTNKVVKTVTVGDGAAAVAIAPNGSDAYVTNDGSGTVSVIQISTNTVVKTVTVGDASQGVAITPNGRDADVANRESNTVSVIKTSTNKVVKTVTVGDDPDGVAIT